MKLRHVFDHLLIGYGPRVFPRRHSRWLVSVIERLDCSTIHKKDVVILGVADLML
jgi:hypothetical protein